MPWYIHTREDLAELRSYTLTRRQDLGCQYCNPDAWGPDTADETLHPCKSPLIPLVRTTKDGKRFVAFEQCQKYVAWAKEHQKRFSTHQQRKEDKAWSK